MNQLLKDYISESKHPDDLIPGEAKEIRTYLKGVLNIQNAPDDIVRRKISYHKFSSGSSAFLVKLQKSDPRKKQIKDWYSDKKVKGLTIEFRE